MSVLSAEARRARGGAPAAGARLIARNGAAHDERSGPGSAQSSNPTLCYAICAFKQLAELMAKFDQFNEEAKVSRAAPQRTRPPSILSPLACCHVQLAAALPPCAPLARLPASSPSCSRPRLALKQESQVDRTESRFLPMKVLRDELPDERLFDGASDDW